MQDLSFALSSVMILEMFANPCGT